MTVYFIRHGQSEFNAAFDPAVGDPLIFDARLSPLGRRQALEAREQVAALGIERVIVSPLSRAIETALHVFHAGPTIEVDPRPRELLSNSCDVGRSPAELARSFPQLSFDHIGENWWHQGTTNENGVAHEPMRIFYQRVSEFRDWLVAQSSQTIAVVGHGNLFKAMIGRTLENCEIHTFEFQGQEIFPCSR
jgi:glucosyl-3-phosphoglycerate phosphatase